MADHEYRSTTVEVQRRADAYQSFLYYVGNDSLKPKMILDAFFELYANMFPKFVSEQNRPSHALDWKLTHHIFKDGLDTPKSFLCGALFLVHALQVCQNARYTDKFGLGKNVNSIQDLIKSLPNVKSDFENEPAFERQVSVGNVILLPKMQNGYPTSNPMFQCDRLRLFRLPSHAEYHNCVCVHQLILKEVLRLKLGETVYIKRALSERHGVRFAKYEGTQDNNKIQFPTEYRWMSQDRMMYSTQDSKYTTSEALHNQKITFIPSQSVVKNSKDKIFKPITNPQDGKITFIEVETKYSTTKTVDIPDCQAGTFTTLNERTLITEDHVVIIDNAHYKPVTYEVQEGKIQSWNSKANKWVVKIDTRDFDIYPQFIYLTNPDQMNSPPTVPIPLYIYRYKLRPNTDPVSDYAKYKILSDDPLPTDINKLQSTMFASTNRQRLYRHLFNNWYATGWFFTFDKCVNLRLQNASIPDDLGTILLANLIVNLSYVHPGIGETQSSRDTFEDNAVATLFMCMATGLLFERLQESSVKSFVNAIEKFNKNQTLKSSDFETAKQKSSVASVVNLIIKKNNNKTLQLYFDTVLQYGDALTHKYSKSGYELALNSKYKLPGAPYLVGEGDVFELPMTSNLSEQENPLLHKSYAKYVQLAELTFRHTLPHKYTVCVVRLNRSDAVCEALKEHINSVIPLVPHPFTDVMSVQDKEVSLTLAGANGARSFLKRDEYPEQDRFALWLNLRPPFVHVQIYESMSPFFTSHKKGVVQVLTNSENIRDDCKTALLDRATKCGQNTLSYVGMWNDMLYLS
jgi:hypothetical protein